MLRELKAMEEKYEPSGEIGSNHFDQGKQETSLHSLDTARKARKAPYSQTLVGFALERT
jgi:hypothetical protein